MNNSYNISADDFRDEMAERLLEWESCILDFEKKTYDQEITNTLFRVVHTIKGVAGSCGYSDIMSFTHELESYLDDVRKGRRKVQKEFIDYMLQAVDLVRRMTAADANSPLFTGSVDRVKEQIRQLSQQKDIEDLASLKFPRVLHEESISRIRTDVVRSLKERTEFRINLSRVEECDVSGVNFICSLVPVFVRTGVPLIVEGISDEIVNRAYSCGVDIRNVLKRASQGTLDPERKVVSHFTITIHPAPGVVVTPKLEQSIVELKQFFARAGTFTEQSNHVEGKKQDCMIFLATTVARRELEDRLETLPEEILWTISLTPDQTQKNDALRHLSKSSVDTEQVKLLDQWHVHFEQLCEQVVREGTNESKKQINELRHIQRALKEKAPHANEMPLSLFVQAMNIIRGD